MSRYVYFPMSDNVNVCVPDTSLGLYRLWAHNRDYHNPHMDSKNVVVFVYAGVEGKY